MSCLRNAFRVFCGTLPVAYASWVTHEIFKDLETNSPATEYVRAQALRRGILKDIRVCDDDLDWYAASAFTVAVVGVPASLSRDLQSSSLYDQQFNPTEQHAFFLHHELTHVEYIDTVERSIAMGAAGTATAVALRNISATTLLQKTARGLLRTGLIAGTSCLTFILHSRLIAEPRADLQAFKQCSISEAKAGIELFKDHQLRFKQQRKDLLAQPDTSLLEKTFTQASIRGNGNLTFFSDPTHPPSSQRIAYLSKALKRREETSLSCQRQYRTNWKIANHLDHDLESFAHKWILPLLRVLAKIFPPP